jgi:hypothetical protein
MLGDWRVYVPSCSRCCVCVYVCVSTMRATCNKTNISYGNVQHFLVSKEAYALGFS